MDASDGFEIGHHQRTDQVEILELVQSPDTVDDWGKLVTSLEFFNAARVRLEVFYEHWREPLRNKCPGFTEKVALGSVDGHSALRSTLSCPKAPQTGKPENFTAILVQGDAHMMMVQIAFRRPLSPPDAALIEHVAGSLKICYQGMEDACSTRTASGFVAAR